jgi:hypothetical protein
LYLFLYRYWYCIVETSLLILPHAVRSVILKAMTPTSICFITNIPLSSYLWFICFCI